MTLARRAGAEALGSALLVAAVVGSGIMGERIAGGNAALALLANSLATGFALAALVIAFGPRSGAHLNPLVTLALALERALPHREIGPYAAAQFAGAICGVLAAHAMFDQPLLQWSTHARAGTAQYWSEAVATFGLLFVVLSCQRSPSWAAPIAIGGYIAAAYWFTASTSFANPAVTLARGFTESFSGIRLIDVGPFILSQATGAALALASDRALRGQAS
jgi:glycerol uptake facilitator-like aquaporin